MTADQLHRVAASAASSERVLNDCREVANGL